MPESKKTLRLFVAIDPPEPTRAAFAGLKDQSLKGVSWIPSHQLHLTLRFIGNVNEEQREKVEHALGLIRVKPFILPVEGVGVFPSKRSPRVIWAGTGNGHPQLFQLRQEIDDALCACEMDLDERAFHPHFTLGRVGKTASRIVVSEFIKQHASFVSVPFQVGEFILYQSELRPEGAIHTPILSVHLPLHDQKF